MTSDAEQDEPELDLAGITVVLDTNVLDQTGLLKDPLSVAMLFYLRHVDGHLVLPEIIRIEWFEHWQDHFAKKVQTFEDHRAWLERYVGELSVETIDAKMASAISFEARLTELGDLLIEEPIENHDWREAGEMVLHKRAPSTAGSQQFKDSLLWRALLRLGRANPLIFASNDKGFSDGSSSSLEASLAEEAIQEGAYIRLVPGRKELLELLQAHPHEFTESIEGMTEEIETSFIDAVNVILESEGWRAGDWPGEWSHEAFATGNPKHLVVALSYQGQLTELEDPDADMPMYVRAEGSALADIDSWDIEIDLDVVTFEVMTPHGDVQRELLRLPGRRRTVLTRLEIDL